MFVINKKNLKFKARQKCNVAYVIRANDVTNPVSKSDPQNPIYGMLALDVAKSKLVLFIKRSLSPDYAGIDNDLFYKDNTLMLSADAKKMTEKIVKSLLIKLLTNLFIFICQKK